MILLSDEKIREVVGFHAFEERGSAIQKSNKAQLKQDREWFINLLIEKGYLRGREVLETQKPTHGNCCTCQGCGYAYDGCICEHNELLQALLKEVE